MFGVGGTGVSAALAVPANASDMISARRNRPATAREMVSAVALTRCEDAAMPPLRPIDLHFSGAPHAIGVYLIETEDGPALFDCGPASTIDTLVAGLAHEGVALEDVRHLLLSHVHLDHAGAAGSLVRRHPGLTVWVSAIGRPHVVAPARLKLLVTLTAVSEVEFSTVRDSLEVSDSLLSKHLTALEGVGYVKRRKGVHRGRRTTWISLTPRGRKALNAHITALRALIDGAHMTRS